MKQVTAILNQISYVWDEKSETSYDEFISSLKKYAEEIKSYAETQNKKLIEAGKEPIYDTKKVSEIKIKESDIKEPVTEKEYNLARSKKISELKKLKLADFDTVKEIQGVIVKLIELL